MQKINLALEIINKRPDGFHDLKSLMIPISLKDEIIFTKGNGLNFASNVAIKDNSIIKVYEVMKNRYNVSEGVSISLIKNIPVGAGLGGGSADIAATIRGLNQFWNLDLDSKEIRGLANELGSDTLFCLYNVAAKITGRGDEIEFISSSVKLNNITLVVPNYMTMTKVAFEHVEFYQHDASKFDKLIEAYQQGDEAYVRDNLYNDMLEANFKIHPSSRAYFKKLQSKNLHPHLSGSGSVFYFIDLTTEAYMTLKEITPREFEIIKTKQL